MLISAASDLIPQFTGKERDAETGLDNFIARYLSAPQDRFMRPDPDNAGASILDPQSWNTYSYVRNDPVNRIDPDGRIDWGIIVELGGAGLPHDWLDAWWRYSMGFYTPFFYSYSREVGDWQLWNALMNIGMVAQNLLGMSFVAPPSWGGGDEPNQNPRQNLVDIAKSKGLKERASDPNCAKFLNGVIANLARVPAGFNIDKLIKNIQSAQINPSGLGADQMANTRDGNTINLGGLAFITGDNGSDLLSRLFHEGFHLKSSGGAGGIGLTESFRDESQLAAAAALASGVDPTTRSFKSQSQSALISQFFGSACGGGWSP